MTACGNSGSSESREPLCGYERAIREHLDMTACGSSCSSEPWEPLCGYWRDQPNNIGINGEMVEPFCKLKHVASYA